ncbi:Endoglucanase-5 [Orbilia brochopaga]|nr:Endoglucanase-5 [Drechslerella brochopaga]
MCINQQPMVDSNNNNIAYGFAAVSIAGQNEQHWCCACYELTLTSGYVRLHEAVVELYAWRGANMISSGFSSRVARLPARSSSSRPRIPAVILGQTSSIWPSLVAVSVSSTAAQSSSRVLQLESKCHDHNHRRL